ncbi:hypothetical protein [Cellulomonas sp. SLBN-39]|uniref:hypothetical protein n=1 Tax=Cellulomonas sp. SLBN-39 TaxID=2768446 RepID=UPI00114E95F9|nr:hypothetical protein [Cellulomonas sp. SLBN-39]TQL04158.1 hypothetical protein FBY24_3271 [Cellulomonas sp. SLBN-39]
MDAPPWDGTGPDDDLPAMPSAPLAAPADALELLLGLVGPEAGGPPALWFVLLDAARQPLPLVLPITDVPPRPDTRVTHELARVLASVLAHDAPDGSVVVALVRAAGGDDGPFERDWSRAVHDACHHAGVTVWTTLAIGAHRARVLHR